MRVLVTGATGFVGQALVRRAAQDKTLQLRTVARRQLSDLPTTVEQQLIDDFAPDTQWQSLLTGVDAIVHTAARVHQLQDAARNPLAEFRRINTAGTLNLAAQAAVAGVRRFVFVSSIGVNGAQTFDKPFTADDPAAPHSPYAVSKHEAELGLRALAEQGRLEVVIVRPPLVCGAQAPGNLRVLMRYLLRGVPLPLAAVRNHRSFIVLDNLVDLLLRCLAHPQAANRTLVASDGRDVSTPELLRTLALALGVSARLFAVPVGLLRTGALLVGRRDLYRQLCGSLQIDSAATRALLGWSPAVSVEAGLRSSALSFLHEQAVNLRPPGSV